LHHKTILNLIRCHSARQIALLARDSAAALVEQVEARTTAARAHKVSADSVAEGARDRSAAEVEESTQTTRTAS